MLGEEGSVMRDEIIAMNRIAPLNPLSPSNVALESQLTRCRDGDIFSLKNLFFQHSPIIEIKGFHGIGSPYYLDLRARNQLLAVSCYYTRSADSLPACFIRFPVHGTQHTMQINFPLHKGNFYLRDSCRIAGSTAVQVSIYDVRIGSLNFPLTGTIFSSTTTFHFHGQRINEWRCYAAVSDIPFRLHWRAIVPLRFLVKRYGRKRALPLHLLGPLSLCIHFYLGRIHQTYRMAHWRRGIR